MGIDDKIKHTGQDLAGRAKEALGHVTEDEGRVAEGESLQRQAQRGRAADRLEDATDDIRQGASDVKDDLSGAARAAKDDVGRALGDAKDAAAD